MAVAMATMAVVAAAALAVAIEARRQPKSLSVSWSSSCREPRHQVMGKVQRQRRWRSEQEAMKAS